MFAKFAVHMSEVDVRMSDFAVCPFGIGRMMHHAVPAGMSELAVRMSELAV